MFVPVMVSCGYRADARARTAADLARHHIHPVLIRTTCTPAKPSLLRRAALKAMAYAAARGADLLWLEDDIRADDRIVDALAMCGASDHPVTLFISDAEHHPPVVMDAMASGRSIPLQILPIPSVRTWWGSQAIYIPRRCMRLLASSPYMLGSHDNLAFDTAIRDIYRDHDLPLYGVFPNPVQHMNEPSARKVTRDQPDRRKRISPTYGWATA